MASLAAHVVVAEDVYLLIVYIMSFLLLPVDDANATDATDVAADIIVV